MLRRLSRRVLRLLRGGVAHVAFAGLRALSRRLRRRSRWARLPVDVRARAERLAATAARGRGADVDPAPSCASARARGLRAWASASSRWARDWAQGGRSRTRRRGVRRTRHPRDARANEAFARGDLRDGMERNEDSWRTEGQGHRARQVQTSQREDRRRRGTGGFPAREGRRDATRSSTSTGPRARRPFFARTPGGKENGARVEPTRARLKRAARSAPRARRRLRRRRALSTTRNAFPGARSCARFTATIAEASASVTRDFTAVLLPLATVRAGRPRRGRGSR